MYDVTLILFGEHDSAYNPVFTFDSKDDAMKLVETFVSQGYGAQIKKDFDE